MTWKQSWTARIPRLRFWSQGPASHAYGIDACAMTERYRSAHGYVTRAAFSTGAGIAICRKLR